MLLLTNILRSRYRGVIHFHPADADSQPEIEFTGGEGPEQVMNQIQDVAVPEIRKNIEPLGPFLRWEELDLETATLRRHRSPFHDRVEFVICPDEMGIQLILSPDAGAPSDAAPGAGAPDFEDERARPWVPLRSLAEPGDDQLARVGWSVAEPDFRWRYLQTRYAPPTIEMSWSCPSLPSPWAARVLDTVAHLDCDLGDSERCPMNPTRDGLLVYRGFYPLPAGAARPASLPVRLEQPLLLIGPESLAPGSTAGPSHLLDEEVPATVEALDARAILGGRPTRLVAREDLARRFEAEVLTGEDTLLPDVIPAGTIPGLPWPLAVTAQGFENDDDHEPGRHAGETGEAETCGRRWRLAPRPRAGVDSDVERGRWRDVAWQGDPPSLAFGLGSFDASRAPRITHIENRRANVAWRVEASDEGHRLCLCVPHWLPVGCPGQAALPPHDANADPNDFDYGARADARLDGLVERFVIDQRSELPGNRLFLGPRRWRFRDQESGEAIDAEALGEGAGCVRWRRPAAGAGTVGGREPGPTDWAGGSAPVLLLPKDRRDPLAWGALYAPRAVPWDALEEVHAEPTPDPEEVLLVPRPPSPEAASAIWIDLWGFVCRYHVRRAAFIRGHGNASRPSLWIARTGLELFPRRSGYLLRSFSPLYAVRDPEPRIFSLRPSAPRPTLHVGRELDAATRFPGGSSEAAPLVLEIGTETFVRHQLTEAGEVPSSFEPGRVPGTRLRLDRVGSRTVWLAVEQRRGDEGRGAGYLLSRDADAGWLFRGFFTHQGAAAELGETRQGTLRRRVFLGGEGASRVSAFRLTLDRHGAHWGEATPEAVSARTTPEMLRAWENDHFVPERRPAPLQGYGMRILQQARADQPWIFELFDRASQTDAHLPPGIRVWEMHGEVDGAPGDGARELGEDPVEEAEPQTPRPPEKRILRADDDNDF